MVSIYKLNKSDLINFCIDNQIIDSLEIKTVKFLRKIILERYGNKFSQKYDEYEISKEQSYTIIEKSGTTLYKKSPSIYKIEKNEIINNLEFCDNITGYKINNYFKVLTPNRGYIYNLDDIKYVSGRTKKLTEKFNKIILMNKNFNK